MAGYAMVAVEGVLMRSTSDEIGTPIPDGVRLYSALLKVYKTVLVTSSTDEDKIAFWCARNDVRGQQTILGPVLDQQVAGAARIRSQQMIELRGLGYDIQLMVDASPRVIAEAMKLGITGLLFASPQYARPEFRPGAKQEIREWTAIEAEVEEQQRLRKSAPVQTADMED